MTTRSQASGKSDKRRHGLTPRTIFGLGMLGLCLLLLWLFNSRRLAYFEVTSESMLPTLPVGTRLLMTVPDGYRVGDLAIFPQPGNPEVRLVKRIVAVGPATVSLRSGQL